MQTVLSEEQIRAFYHDQFVEDQVRHYMAMVPEYPRETYITDVGGGCGFFARRLVDVSGRKVRVIDMDAFSVETCRQAGLAAEVGDALTPRIVGDESVVTFNLILHHLVGASDMITASLQRTAIEAWRTQVRFVFVNEYIYESFVGNWSGRLIYAITKNSVLSWIGRNVSRVIPALKANTFGVGVRFRSNLEWQRLFEQAGYRVVRMEVGESERVALPLRMLFIRQIRRDSFLLSPSHASQ